MSKRRLEFVEGKSSKFWEIELGGASHVVRFGRIGSAGQTRTKSFASPEAARLDAAALIEEKLAKGYHDASSEGSPAATPPSRVPAPGTRYTLTHRANPAAPFVLVLAGTRLVTNDVAQDFPSAAAAHEHLERVVMLRMKEGYVLTATEQVSAEEADLAAETGEDVEVKSADGRWTGTFLGQKAVPLKACAKLLRRLQKDGPRRVDLICDQAVPGAHWASAIEGQLFASVRAFVLDTYFQTQTRQGHNSIGDLAATFDALPSLERAFLTGQLSLSPCQHRTLAELHLLGDPLPEELLRALGASQLPALQRLVLSLASDAGPGPQDAAIDALLSLRTPRLREVYVDGLEDLPAALDKLLRAGAPPSWKVLGLSGPVADEQRLLAVLAAHASRLSALEAFALPLGDEVSAPGDEAARALLPNLRDTEELKALTLPAAYQAW